jgi:hypothetical protein
VIRSVNVLGRIYKVRWNAKLPTDRWGDHDYAKGLIRIGKAPQIQQRETLLHELMHAIEDESGFEMDHDQLTIMARALLGVMTSNPGLATKIFGE